MSTSGADLHLSAVGVVVVPVADQAHAVAWFTEVLGFENTSDFAYETGERWVEVVPPGSLTRLTLVTATADRPAGIETGVIFTSGDAPADHAALLAAGADVDPGLSRPATSSSGPALRSPATRRCSACAIRTGTRT